VSSAIGANGPLTGYRGGLECKQAPLDQEHALTEQKVDGNNLRWM
jgi:hypothetical protein